MESNKTFMSIKTEVKENPIKVSTILLLILVTGFLIYFLFDFSGENRRLSKENKTNSKKIDSLELVKKPILKDIDANSEEIAKKDSLILVLTNKSNIIKSKLNYYINENNRLKNDYVNAGIDERIRKFTKLATEKDSI